MSPAEIGTEVSLFYDSRNRVHPGDFMVTPTGRTYHVTQARIQHKGKHQGRQHLKAIVVEPGAPDEGDVVHVIRWYSRSSGSGTRLTNRGKLVAALGQAVLGLTLLCVGSWYATHYIVVSAR